ncbi:tetratricopeptide repeat protein [Pseudemcibacter aquimaris]|uniref:tetratricopeptide repeat protein n=1 Tax=Pseudemcibacter aquimaris TaxID=2857064 RepID=UPI002010F423|nr:tetratricopeptide repeat protein [Pseudemcibacter aquimaris]MCC3859811.1 sel1 repeat family protein [Pseudemcibacter aquimaris]WDU60205.1 sel1 repeat family protein [Pseudemcibacter aquimaris]
MSRYLLFSLLVFTGLFSSVAYADNKKGEEAYENGNYEVALVEFTKAAEAGDADAQYNLGVMYEHGHGVEQDEVQAAEWYIMAADNGHPEASLALSLLYEDF